MMTTEKPFNVTIANSSATEEQPGTTWLPISYVVVGCIGTIINLLVCIVLLKQVHKKPLTKRYSLNLSVGNTLYSIAAIAVYTIWPDTSPQTQGKCSFVMSLYLLSYYLCINSMILLATERICAVRFPLYFRKMTNSRNITVQLSISWGLAMLFAVYPAVDFRLMTIPTEFGPLYLCVPAHPKVSGVYNLILDLIVPLIVFIWLTVWAIIALNKRPAMVAAVGEARRNVPSLRRTKLHLMFLNVMFSMCFGPYFIFSIIDLTVPSFKQTPIHEYIRLISILLTFSHTWINPIMQWTCDKCFRNDAIRTFCCREPKKHEMSRDTGVPTTIS